MPKQTIPPKKKQKIPSPEFQDPKICRDIRKTPSGVSLQAIQEPGDTDDGKKVTSKITDIETTQEKHLTLPTGQGKLGTISVKELEDEIQK